MYTTWWRAALFAGASLALFAGPVGAQDTTVLSLDDALTRSGVIETSSDNSPNPRLIGPAEDAAAARALIDQARILPGPEISLEAENIAGSGAYSGLSATEYTVSVGQRLELGGKRSARIRSAEADALVVTLQSKQAAAQLGRDVRIRYVAAAAASSRSQLAREIVERNRELVRIADLLVDVGREPPLRALRARAALAEAEAELQPAEATSLSSRIALAALWSGEAAAPVVPADIPNIVPPANLLASDDTLRLQIARAKREAADAAVDRERALAVPDPVVSAGIRRFAESRDQAFLVGVTLPLPFNNRNRGNIAAAQSRLRAANAHEAVAKADYRLDIEQTRARYLAAETRAQILADTSLPQAEEALRLVDIGYRNGRFPLIEVLAAAEARDTIREALIQAQEDRARLAAELIWLAAQ
ncbi:TolC family protein [Tsuneonella suprasediminis]|uniref:TolC family protein n=1 Tax=Tsuneonella suprasediminis TaxID=2306996 RepID=UPI002F92F35E